jgi:predicted HAD superfamily Cof-like phosphohydrolase
VNKRNPYSILSIQELVDNFHDAMGLKDPTRPVDPSPEVRAERAWLINEESLETSVALVGAAETYRMVSEKLVEIVAKRGSDPGGLIEIVDGCVDTAVVVNGTLSRCGVDAVPVEDEVMRANMAKVGGGRDEHGKFQKPAGWTPPDIEGCLRRQGWKP